MPASTVDIPLSPIVELSDNVIEENTSLAAAAGATDPGRALMFGRYVGQITARIGRAWIRPRTPLPTLSDRFECRARIEQDKDGTVRQVELELSVAFSIVWILSWGDLALSSEEQPMSTEPASFIAELVSAPLEQAGFVRSGLSWYRYGDESIEVINIQPARYSPGPYVNLGIYYYKYGQNDKPETTDCHVDTRLTMLLSKEKAFREIELLDPTNDVLLDTRRVELLDLIRSYGIPWLEKMAKLETARALLAKQPDLAHVAPVARIDLQPAGK